MGPDDPMATGRGSLPLKGELGQSVQPALKGRAAGGWPFAVTEGQWSGVEGTRPGDHVIIPANQDLPETATARLPQPARMLL